MNQHDFIVTGCDTDSISFCYKDGRIMSAEEQQALIDELNSLMPEKIRFAHDGYFKKQIILKTKNYILQDEDGIKIKGSALKDQKKETALREFLDKIIESMLNDREDFSDIYHTYVREIMDVKDIKRWSSKKTITDKVLTGTRANETKVKDAIAGTDYKEADKIWLFFKSDESLCLAEKFDGVDYNKKRLLEKLYKTALVFESVLSVKILFLNYSLKRNEKLLTLSGYKL